MFFAVCYAWLSPFYGFFSWNMQRVALQHTFPFSRLAPHSAEQKTINALFGFSETIPPPAGLFMIESLHMLLAGILIFLLLLAIRRRFKLK